MKNSFRGAQKALSGLLIALQSFAFGLVLPATTYAATYSIDISSSNLSGFTLSLSGTATGTQYSGQLADHQVQIDWGDGNVDNDSTINFVDPAEPSNPQVKDFSGTWSSNPNHTYATGGNYTVKAKVYHGNPPGNEASGDAIDTISVFVPGTSTVTVTKVVVGGTKVVADFPLTLDGSPVTSGVPVVVAPGAHVAAETTDPDYTATFSGACDSQGLITVATSSSASCTITNTFSAAPTTGVIEVVKNVVASDGTTNVADATTFTVTLNGSSDTSFGEGLNAIFANLTPGDYTLAELAQAGYQLVGFSASSTATVTAGATTTVTVTNRQLGTTGTLTVHKVVVNNEVGPLGADAFTLYVDGMPVTRDVATTTAAGDHVVSEDSEDGYQATFSGDCDENGNVSVPVEGSAECTITNTWVGTGFGDVVITKIVEGGEATVESFTLNVGDTAVTSGATNEFAVGDYQVSETNLPGYSASFGGDCTSDGMLTVVSDETVTCVITNTFATTGGLVIEKEVLGADGETDVEDSTEFYFQVNGGEQGNFGEGNDAEISGLEPGDYSVTELLSETHILMSISPATATVEAGATTTVTITNRQKRGTGVLVIEKNVVAADGVSEVADETSFTVVVGETGASAGENAPAVFNDMAPGDYVVTELPQEGYELVSISPATATVAVEGTTTVVVTNRQLSSGGDGDSDDDDEDDGSRRGSRSGRRSSGGEVLGASTEACDMYLTDFIHIGWTNSAEQVTRLQNFLNTQFDPDIPVTGVYDQATYDYVLKFQVENTDEVLIPWINLGLHDNENRGTGFVYKTTRWLINRIASPECPGPAPILP
jgi:hypothetical protein